MLKAHATSLQISNNYLGYEDASGDAAKLLQKNAGGALTPAGWCKAADNNWDPATVDTAVAGSLELLDVSSNGLAGKLSTRPELHSAGCRSGTLPPVAPHAPCAVERGALRPPAQPCSSDASALGVPPPHGFSPPPAGPLPASWPKLFPKLQYLMLYGNDLYGAATRKPSPMPGDWSAGVKRGFPLLKELVLYPGNEDLCAVPTNENAFLDVNLGERWPSALPYNLHSSAP